MRHTQPSIPRLRCNTQPSSGKQQTGSVDKHRPDATSRAQRRALRCRLWHQPCRQSYCASTVTCSPSHKSCPHEADRHIRPAPPTHEATISHTAATALTTPACSSLGLSQSGSSGTVQLKTGPDPQGEPRLLRRNLHIQHVLKLEVLPCGEGCNTECVQGLQHHIVGRPVEGLAHRPPADATAGAQSIFSNVLLARSQERCSNGGMRLHHQSAANQSLKSTFALLMNEVRTLSSGGNAPYLAVIFASTPSASRIKNGNPGFSFLIIAYDFLMKSRTPWLPVLVWQR